MIDPHIAQSCSAPLELSAGVSIDDVSLDFGEGAIVLSCVCGAWAVEDSSGTLLAWSESVEAALAQLPRAAQLSGAA
jgi:hypothetical protein